uniref:uncharacterized protein LOC122593962 n=1 Tax=Erigeron canadensis TaxID=72917 RepID=UPI001CB99A2C|nr:uncharacterized protein LOC122593962 [Erigeron canadensis]
MKSLCNIMVLFLVVITNTGLLSCTHSNNDQEILMVVDDDNPSTQQMEQTIQAENRLVQTAGRFKLEDGKYSLKRLRMKGRENTCVDIDQPCGLFDYCCDGLHCDGTIDGRCRQGRDEDCVGLDQPCGALDHCCNDLHCDGFIKGRCKAADYCIPIGDSCTPSRVPCCDAGICDGPIFGKCRAMDYCLPTGSSCMGSPFQCCSRACVFWLSSYHCL